MYLLRVSGCAIKRQINTFSAKLMLKLEYRQCSFMPHRMCYSWSMRR